MDLQTLKEQHIKLPREYGEQYHVMIKAMVEYKKKNAGMESNIAKAFLGAKHSGMTLDEAKAEAKMITANELLLVIGAEAEYLKEKANLETIYETMVGIRELSAFERKEMHIMPDGENIDTKIGKYLKG